MEADSDRGSVLDAAVRYIRYLQAGQLPGRAPFAVVEVDGAGDDSAQRKRRRAKLLLSGGGSGGDGVGT